MSRQLTYFDNAATTYPKPDVVYKAHDQYLRIAGNPGRGAHELAIGSARVLVDSRLAVAELLGITQPERLIFTPGCTQSINMVLQGYPLQEDDVVLVSALEHNAVMRTLRHLQKTKNINVAILRYAKKGIIDLHMLVEAMLDYRPKLFVFSEASNVTGEVVDMMAISAICQAHRVPFVVDAAQSAGRTTKDVPGTGAAAWCASGHKGLFGSPGAGLLYISPGFELEPLIAGGTGSGSEDLDMPTQFPDRFEPGTLPGPAIAALGVGAVWLKNTGVEKVVQHESALTRQFLEWCWRSGLVRVYGNREEGGTAVVSFTMDGIGCDRVAQLLNDEFGIAVRAGLHCAATAHSALGTLETGLVRASFSYFNTSAQIEFLCESLKAIAGRVMAGSI